VVEERSEGLAAVAYIGDDVGDLPAFDALDRLAERGRRAVKVAVRTPDVSEALCSGPPLVDGPDGVARPPAVAGLTRRRQPQRRRAGRRASGGRPRLRDGAEASGALARSSSGIVSASCSTSAVPATSNGGVRSAAAPSRSHAPGLR
jgi:hypothetical protein